MAYSIDYRKAAIEFKRSGHTFKQLKEVFRIAPHTYYQWLKLLEKTGSLQFGNAKTRRRKISSEELIRAVEEKPDSYLRELAEKFACSSTAVYKRLKKLGFTYKKRRSHTLKNQMKRERNLSRK
jgi:transposase